MNRSVILIPLLAVLVVSAAGAQQITRSVTFSGYTWEVRRSDGLAGPGPNRFIDNRRTVWTDEAGDLHLKIWSRLGQWFCAEVSMSQSLGYGTYIFETVGALDNMDPPVILGLFTYDHEPEYEHREIDIEYGLFGREDGSNGQFVLQPHDVPGNAHRFTAGLEGDYLTHAFYWSEDRIEFAAYHGHRGAEIAELAASTGALVSSTGDLSSNAGSAVMAHWEYAGDVPPPGEERVHINLWLYQGERPDRDHEVIIRSFTFAGPAS